MNAEMLNSLSIDRAFGELTPEVEALLDAYLALQPDVARREQAAASLVRDARAAVTVSRSGALALPPALRVRVKGRADAGASVKRAWWSSPSGELLRLAVCLAVGLLVGAVWQGNSRGAAGGDSAQTPTATAQQTRTSEHSLVAANASSTSESPAGIDGAPVASVPGRLDFWAQAQADVLSRDREAGGAGPRIAWSSAVKFPTWEDKR